MSILVIPSQNQEKILTGVRARDADNNFYFISCEADLHAVNPRETGKTYCTLYITPDRHLIGDKSIDCFVPDMKTLKESGTEYNIRPIYAYRDSSRLSLTILRFVVILILILSGLLSVLTKAFLMPVTKTTIGKAVLLILSLMNLQPIRNILTAKQNISPFISMILLLENG